MAKSYGVICGVPAHHCTGGTLQTDQQLGTTKVHSSHEEAFRCYSRYLTRVKGYKRIGPREFAPPDGGPVLVLTKKSRFGAHLRKGKEGRLMPKRGAGIVNG